MAHGPAACLRRSWLCSHRGCRRPRRPTNPRVWVVAPPWPPLHPRPRLPPLAAVPTPRPRIGLVLSGGGARGAAHIGVLKVLEELRVPVDVIAGTSMGSIVGGSYASGQTVAAMTRDVANIKTDMLARDQPPRSEISIHLKQEDWLDYIGPQFGYRDGSLQLPKGAITGVALEAVLRDLALAKGDSNFDKLPIPFRAIATDVVSGQMTVLRSGDLAIAMRASMSVPGAIAPVQIDGKMLVDGGLTRNLPVDVARAMGADVIIAVNLGTPLLPRDQIISALSVAAQMLNILTEQNVQRLAGVAETHGCADPAGAGQLLGRRLRQHAQHHPHRRGRGAQGGRPVAPLQPAAAAVRRASPAPGACGRGGLARIDEIRVEGLSRVNEEVVIQSMETPRGRAAGCSHARPGHAAHLRPRRLRACRLQADRRARSPHPGGGGGREGLGADLRALRPVAVERFPRRQRLQPAGQHPAHLGQPPGRRMARRRAAGQRRLAVHRVLPAAGAEPVLLHRTARDGDQRAGRHLTAARTATTWQRATTSPSAPSGWTWAASSPSTASCASAWWPGRAMPSCRSATRCWRSTASSATSARCARDCTSTRLDSTSFPRSGYNLDAQVLSSSTRLGASDTYNRWTGRFVGAKSFGAHTFQFALAGGGSIGGNRCRCTTT